MSERARRAYTATSLIYLKGASSPPLSLLFSKNKRTKVYTSYASRSAEGFDVIDSSKLWKGNERRVSLCVCVHRARMRRKVDERGCARQPSAL